MRTEQPKMIYLKDYQAPDYLIDETHLTFELFEDHSLVHAQLVMRRNPERGAGLPPLVLDGQQLELLSVNLADQPLTDADYQLTDSHLTVQPKSETFTLDTTVKIHPETNTALEGLYKSSGMFCTQCEAEGFRKITYYLDRPDVMSVFTTTVIAEQHSYPVLLSIQHQRRQPRAALRIAAHHQLRVDQAVVLEQLEGQMRFFDQVVRRLIVLQVNHLGLFGAHGWHPSTDARRAGRPCTYEY